LVLVRRPILVGVAKTRWLTTTEQRAWRSYVDATTLLFDALDRQLQQDSGMPHAYFEILVRLSEAPQRSMRMSELADATRSSRSRLSHAVARLEERGWVVREDCLTDKRGQVARLTDDGVDALASAAPGHVAAVRASVFDRLSPEQVEQLTGIATAVINGLAGTPAPGTPARGAPAAVARASGSAAGRRPGVGRTGRKP
jgi:DNA-binding MarR family transcriptional regulator